MMEKGQRVGKIVDEILLPLQGSLTRALYEQIWERVYAYLMGVLP